MLEPVTAAALAFITVEARKRLSGVAGSYLDKAAQAAAAKWRAIVNEKDDAKFAQLVVAHVMEEVAAFPP